MVFTNITPFPATLTPLTNISPLTYRDAGTFLEYLETIKQWLNETLVPETDTLLENAIAEFQEGIANAEATVNAAKDGWTGQWDEWTEDKAAEYAAFVASVNASYVTFTEAINASQAAFTADINADFTSFTNSANTNYTTFVQDIEALVDLINNKSGPIDIQRATLVAPYTVNIDPLWPTNQPVSFALAQDATGGRAITLGANILGPLNANLSANAVTEFTLIPNGAGKWNVRNAPETVFGNKRGTFEFYDDYTNYPDGAMPAKALTGQPNSLHSATAPAGYPIISGGFMTYGANDYLGGYVSRQLDESVVRIGASVAFTPWSTGGGIMCIAVMEEDIHATQLAGQGVPRSPFHFTMGPEAWGLDVFTTKGQPKVNVGGGLWATPLVADGTTLHHVEGIIDRENKKVYLTLPDGTTREFSHASFGIAARWVFDEPFRDTNDAGKTLAKFRQFWADSRNVSPIPLAKAAAKIPLPQKFQSYTAALPAGDNGMVLSDTASKVAGTDRAYTVPPGTNVLVRLEALLDVTADGPVHFGVFAANNAMIAVETVATKIGNGKVSCDIAINYGVAGAQASISMCAYRGPTAAAKIIHGNYLNTNGHQVYGRVTVTVTPLS